MKKWEYIQSDIINRYYEQKLDIMNRNYGDKIQ